MPPYSEQPLWQHPDQIRISKKLLIHDTVPDQVLEHLQPFSKFGSDLDAATMAVLNKGSRNVEILKQGLYDPQSIENQIAILFCGTKGLLKDVPLDSVQEFEVEYLEYLGMKHKNIMDELRQGKITSDAEKILREVVIELTAKYRD